MSTKVVEIVERGVVMIDLNRKPKKEEQKELPVAAQIFLLLPFAFLLWLILTTSFINGIY